MTAPNAIPKRVLELLEHVRSEGKTNMLAASTVFALALRAAEEYDDNDWWQGAVWLYENDDRYMEALKEMGARRVR